MKLVVAGLIVATALGGAASAADMPVKARPVPPAQVYNWTGFYIGGSAGYAWGDVDWVYHDPTGVLADRPITNNPASADGGFGGGHVGYQRQFGAWVLGVEANYLHGGSSIEGAELCFSQSFTCHVRLSNWWTVGGRLGYASDRWMIYGTGGYASGSIRTHEVTNATGAVVFPTSGSHDGWFAGAGIEYAITNWIVLGVEYSHLDFDTKFHLSTTSSEDRNIGAQFDTVRARLTFRLGSP